MLEVSSTKTNSIKIELPRFDRAGRLRGRGESALWREIASLLREPIANGAWPPGFRVPSVDTLAEHFDVNPHTIRKAVSVLVREDHLTTARGRGTFVTGGARLSYDPSHPRRFFSCVEAVGQTAGMKLLGYDIEEAGEKLGADLRMSPMAAVHKLYVLLTANDQPRGLATYWFPHGQFVRMDTAFRKEASLADALKHFGVTEYAHRQTSLSSRLATKAEALHMRLQSHAPVLLVDSVSASNSGEPIFASQVVLNAAHVKVDLLATST
ncbi:MAG: UTRA domain-containing protein [Pseudomonadota bacterium]